MKAIARGAEATVYESKDVVIKDREKKRYRIEEIDSALRKSRTRSEFNILKKCVSFGINVPQPIKISEDGYVSDPTVAAEEGAAADIINRGGVLTRGLPGLLEQLRAAGMPDEELFGSVGVDHRRRHGTHGNRGCPYDSIYNLDATGNTDDRDGLALAQPKFDEAAALT